MTLARVKTWIAGEVLTASDLNTEFDHCDNNLAVSAELAASSGSSLIGFIQSGTGAVARTVQSKEREIISITDFGGDQTGIVNTVAAYNLAVAAISASGVKSKLFFPAGTYKFSAAIILDISLMSVECENVIWDFSSISTSATALTITGSVGDIYSQIKDVLTGVIIKGPGTGGSSIGVYFDSASEPGPGHSCLRNVGITNFYAGTSYSRNAYIITFDHCNIYANARGFQSYVGTSSNSGERITFINSSIFNNTVYGLRVEDTNASIHIISTSIDYNQQGLYLGSGAVHFTSCYQEFSDQIGGSDPRFLYADAAGGNTAFVSYSDCTFKIGVVASPTSTPVFDVTSTVNLSHSNCEFYLNTNRSVIFKMRTGSFYNEVNAKAQYAGTSFRTLDTGSAYTIASTGQNQVGIKTTGDLTVANPSYTVNGVTPITDIFTAAYAAGQTATSNVALANGIYTLYTHTQNSANDAQAGQYVIQRMGTQAVITAIANDTWVTVAINGSFNVTVTNASGSKTLDCILIRNAAQNI